MVWEFQCPIDDWEFSKQPSEETQVIESAQEHTRTAHGTTPSQEEIEQYVISPGCASTSVIGR